MAPVSASIPFSPKVKGPALPINWSVNSASDARFPRPSVSFGVSMVRALIVPSSFFSAWTVTSPPKPCSVASVTEPAAAGSSCVFVSSGAASSPAASRLIAFRAAVEVTVAPDRASIPSSPKVNGPLLPMNCSVNSASDARLPRPSVSFGVSMVRALIVPSSFFSARTVTSPPKPCSVASEAEPAAAGSAAGSSVGSSAGSAAGSSSFSASAGTASSPVMIRLIAFRAAVEVTVAPDRASIPSSPKVNGPLLPMNCSVNSASDARLPRPSVSFGVSMDSSRTALSSMTACTVTSPPKPCSVASAEATAEPSDAAGS